MLIAAIPETHHWYQVDTRALFDGDGGLPLGAQPDVLPEFLLVVTAVYLAFGILGAWLGSRCGRLSAKRQVQVD